MNTTAPSAQPRPLPLNFKPLRDDVLYVENIRSPLHGQCVCVVTLHQMSDGLDYVTCLPATTLPTQDIAPAIIKLQHLRIPPPAPLLVAVAKRTPLPPRPAPARKTPRPMKAHALLARDRKLVSQPLRAPRKLPWDCHPDMRVEVVMRDRVGDVVARMPGTVLSVKNNTLRARVKLDGIREARSYLIQHLEPLRA